MDPGSFLTIPRLAQVAGPAAGPGREPAVLTLLPPAHPGRAGGLPPPVPPSAGGGVVTALRLACLGPVVPGLLPVAVRSLRAGLFLTLGETEPVARIPSVLPPRLLSLWPVHSLTQSPRHAARAGADCHLLLSRLCWVQGSVSLDSAPGFPCLGIFLPWHLPSSLLSFLKFTSATWVFFLCLEARC